MRGEVSVVQGEVSQLLSAMRKTGRWSGHARTEGEQDPLIRGLHKLQVTLNTTSDLRTLDVMVFLHPFCEIIQSDDTTGPVTGLAISSLDRFLSYGLISPARPSAATGVAALSESVTHARFVGTNPASDEVVLMKILQKLESAIQQLQDGFGEVALLVQTLQATSYSVLHTLMLTPVGRLLSNESVCEIMQSCFRICFEMRLSELLRNYAETTLVDMVQLLFIQLPSFSEDQYTVDDTASIIDQTITAGGEGERGSVEPLGSVGDEEEEGGGEGGEDREGKEATDSNGGEDEHDQLQQQEEVGEEDGSALKPTAKEAEFVSSDVIAAASRQRQGTLAPYGLPCVRELLRFLVSIINIRERANSESLLHIGLNLVTVAMESGRQHLCRFPSLAQLVQDNLSRHLFTLLRHSNFSVFSATLRAICLLLQHCRVHLRFQVEWGLNSLMELFSPENAKLSHERKEAVLESILRLCHYPYLMAELYVNYDCSLYCSNVFENLTKLLSKSALPTQGLSSNHLLSLDALLAIVENFQSWQQPLSLDTAIEAGSQVSQPETREAEDAQGHLAVSRGSTQINSAGIIFSSGPPDRENELTLESSISSVRSESALADHVNEASVAIARQSSPIVDRDVVKAASGYMMATRGVVGEEGEGEFVTEIPVVELPFPKNLIEIRQRKKVILAATEQFNNKPKQGIAFLQERRVVSASDSEKFPEQVASFLVANPWLDKARIGEYIGDRRNPAVLDAFVRRFSLHGSHLVDALRHFLESFRLPGESPIIARILETFSEHWLSCNREGLGSVFANRDAVYVLCYAILMLNTDQYSAQVKKRMSLEEFIHNQRKINNGEDFPRQFLTDIFNRIREEEIIMPHEHVGQVKENYQWKVLLHRSSGPEAVYLPVSVTSYNQDLYLLCWSQTVAALSYVFENAEEKAIVLKAINGFSMCASVAANYELNQVFDKLVISLCKFTTLLNPPESPNAVVMTLGTSSKTRQCLLTMFSLAHQHGNILREGWKNILDALVALFRAKLLPDELVQVRDFVHPTGSVSLFREEAPSTRADSSLLSSLSFWLLNESPSGASKPSTPSEIKARKTASKCVKECRPEQIVTESKFLRPQSLMELIKTLTFCSRSPEDHVALGTAFQEETAVFFLELLVAVAMENKDRVGLFFTNLINHLARVIQTSQKYSFFLERCVVGLLRLVIRMMNREPMVSELLGSLRILLALPSPVSQPYLLSTHQQVASAIAELIQTKAGCVKTQRDWTVLLFVLEVVGTGCGSASASNKTWLPSLTEETGELSRSASESTETELQSSKPLSAATKTTNAAFLESLSKFDVLVEESIEPHDPDIFFKCCKTLSDLVRSDILVTAANFSACVHCIRTFSEVSGCGLALEHEASMGRLHPFHMAAGSSRYPGRSLSPTRASSTKTGADTAPDKENQSYTTSSLQLLDLMDTLFSRIGRVFTPKAVVSLKKEFEVDGGRAAQPRSDPTVKPGPGSSCGGNGGLLWRIAWCPLLQGMARMCCDTRKSVRQMGITFLQRALLAHELQNLASVDWESCFLQVFFPMLSRLLEVTPTVDLFNLEETRVRASNLLCKVFLQHLLSLSSLAHFPDLWFGILDFMEKYLSLENSDLLSEAIPESIKNLLLVMSTQGVLEVCLSRDTANKSEASLNLLQVTWLRIEQFLPGFMNQLFPSVSPPVALSTTPPPPPQAPPAQIPQPQSSTDHTTSSEAVLEVPVNMDQASGGVATVAAARPMQAQCSPSRSPPGTSPHASPPTTSSPVAELQAKGEVSIGNFPVTLHPPLPTVTTIPVSQSQETSGPQQSLILVQPATQNTPPAVQVPSLLNL